MACSISLFKRKKNQAKKIIYFYFYFYLKRVGSRMALVILAKVSSRIKGHHVYNYTYTIGEQITAEMEDDNVFNRNAIVIFSRLDEKIGT